MKICLGITGSIAAYRSPDLVKELVLRGHEVRIILTAAAKQLVSTRVLSTFSGFPILSEDPFGEDHAGTDHISVARWADVFLVYAATADFLGRYAQGMGSDFLSLQLLAVQCPVMVVPAMNPSMWSHPAVQENFNRLRERGVQFVGPIQGQVACGEVGVGHIADLSSIIEALPHSIHPILQGKRVLISAGPMRTSLDQVRYLQNRSSGKMGLEIALAAKKVGAEVSVLLGPVESHVVEAFKGFKVQRYRGPVDYERQLSTLFENSDIFFSLAAVLDFEFITHTHKIEREALSECSELRMPMRPVRDYVAQMAALKQSHQCVIAFAAESGSDEEILDRATRKMKKKAVDILIANPVRPGLGPEAEQNELWILRPNHAPVHIHPALKKELAMPLLKALFY